MEISLLKHHVDDILRDSNIFLVNVIITPFNKIAVYVDSEEGIKIRDCVEISRKLRSILGENIDDFELEVSSPGLGEAFVVAEQYKKNIGKEVEVVMKSGEKIVGVLKCMENNIIKLDEEKVIKVEGKKKKQPMIFNHSLNLDNVKSTKIVISFK